MGGYNNYFRKENYWQVQSGVKRVFLVTRQDQFFKGKYRMIVLRKNEGERYTVQICGSGKNMISVKAKREQKKSRLNDAQ